LRIFPGSSQAFCVTYVDKLGRLAIGLEVDASGPLPSEIRLFSAGWNETENGRFLFDAAAASAVMAAYQAHGVDRMFDLEHLSLDSTAPHFDPDARGWCKLELREGPELWAVDIRWTPDGEARLRDKRQRYVSPAFEFEVDSGRVAKLVNVALTALPATHGTAALVAARAGSEGTDGMDPKQLEAVMKAAGLDPKMMAKVASALGLDANASADDVKAAIDAFAAKMEKIEDLLSEGDAGGEGGDSDAPPPPEPPPDMSAAANRIVALTGRGSLAESVSAIEAWRESHLALEADRAKLEADRAKLEASERRGLVADLVKLGVEIPATAWSDQKGTVPVKRLADEPLPDLRSRVAALRAARVGAPSAPKVPASPASGGEHEVPERLRGKVDPAKYAAMRAAIAARKVG
jgi:phage I-like protein